MIKKIEQKREPTQKRAIEKKERIISAAYKLLEKSCIAEIGIREISEEAGVSIGIIYSYFNNKYDIFHEVHKHFDEDYYGPFMEKLLAELPNTDVLEDVVRALVDKIDSIAQRNRKLHREFIILALTDKEFNKKYETIKTKSARTIGIGLFNRFSSLVRVDDPEAAAVVVQKAIDEIIKYMLLYEVTIPKKRIIDQTVKMITRYLKK